jgi:hypothetical protein
MSHLIQDKLHLSIKIFTLRKIQSLSYTFMAYSILHSFHIKLDIMKNLF